MRRFLTSDGFRILLGFAVLVSLGAAGMAVALLAFRDVETERRMLAEQRTPEIAAAVEIASLSNAFATDLFALRSAQTEQELEAAGEGARAALAALRRAAANAPAGQAERLTPIIAELESSTGRLIAGAEDELAKAALVSRRIAAFQKAQKALAGQIAAKVAEASDKLSSGGHRVVQAVEGDLAALSGTHLARLVAALDARARLGALSGLAATLAVTAPGLDERRLSGRILVERMGIKAAFAAYEDTGTTMDKGARDATDAVTAAIDAYREQRKSRSSAGLDPRDPGFSTRLARLVKRADDLLRLTVSGTVSAFDESAAQAAATADSRLSELIRNEIGALAANVRLASQATELARLISTAAVSLDQKDVEDLGRAAAAMSFLILPTAKTAGLSESWDAAGRFALGKDNIFSTRRLQLAAAEASSALAADSLRGATALSAASTAYAHDRLNAIRGQTEELESLIAKSELRLTLVGATAAALVLLIAWFVVYRGVSRRLSLLSAATERLASGDLAEVSVSGRREGEIGRMAAALGVFREGLIDKARLEREEAENARRRAEAERREREERERREAEEARVSAARQDADRARAEAEREAREHELLMEEERKRHEQAAAEEARRREIERQAETERAAHAAAQEAVVAALAKGLKRLSTGDLAARIETPFADGYEALRRDFNRAVEGLSRAVAEIKSTVSHVAENADLAGGTASDLADDVSRNAATLEETATALDQLTGSVRSTAETAHEANRIVGDAQGQAQRTGPVMRTALEAMKSIERSSTKISDIINVIEEIAFQTNLLSLNASVEAARAGEAGRGFAVVATEVRALAQRSSTAAAEITEIIGASVREVERGVGLMDETGAAMEGILTAIGDISAQVKTITELTDSQSDDLSEVNAALARIDEAMRRSAEKSDGAIGAANGLTADARALAQAVGAFRTERESPAARAA